MNRRNLSSMREQIGFWLALGLLLLLILGGWAAISHGNNTDLGLRERLLQQATDIAHTIEPVGLDAPIFSPGGQETWAYQQLQGQLATYGHFINHQAIRLLALRDGRVVQGPGSFAADDPQAIMPGTPYITPPPELWNVFATGKPTTSGPYTNARGTFVSAYAPVIGPHGDDVSMVIALDVPANNWMAMVWADSLAVIVATLLILLLALCGLWAIKWRNRLPLESQKRWLYLEPMIVFLIGGALTIATSLLVVEAEASERHSIFGRIASTTTIQVEETFREVERKLDSLKRFYVSGGLATREEFALFAGPLAENSTPQAFGWVPRVRAEELSAYEAQVRGQGTEDFSVWEFDEDGTRRPAAPRTAYYPLEFMVTAEAEAAQAAAESPLGFDIASEVVRRAALQQAESSGSVAATEYLKTRGSYVASDALLAIHPVFAALDAGVDSTQDSTQNMAESRQPLGFVLAWVRMQSIIERLLRDDTFTGGGAAVHVVELVPGTAPTLIAAYPLVDSARIMVAPQNFMLIPQWRAREAHIVSPIFTLGRTYAVVMDANSSFYAQHPLQSTWLVMLTGSIFTVIGTLSVALLRRRQMFLEQEVRHHTAAQARSETRNRSIVQAIPDIILHFDRAGVVLETLFSTANSPYANQVELLGRSYQEILPAEIIHEFAGAIELAFETQKLQQVEFSMPVSGGRRWYEARLVCQQDEDGWAWVRDITQRKKDEQELKHQIELQRTLMRLATELVNLPVVELDSAIQGALATVGRFAAVDRAYLFRYDFERRIMSNTHEWYAKGITPEIENLREVSFDLLPQWVESHYRGELVLVERMADLPVDSPLYALLPGKDDGENDEWSIIPSRHA